LPATHFIRDSLYKNKAAQAGKFNVPAHGYLDASAGEGPEAVANGGVKPDPHAAAADLRAPFSYHALGPEPLYLPID
jgi:hypothetical protein